MKIVRLIENSGFYKNIPIGEKAIVIEYRDDMINVKWINRNYSKWDGGGMLSTRFISCNNKRIWKDFL